MAFLTRRAGVLAIMALAMVAAASAARPPKELCAKTIVVTELYNEDTLSVPEFLMTETNQVNILTRHARAAWRVRHIHAHEFARTRTDMPGNT